MGDLKTFVVELRVDVASICVQAKGIDEGNNYDRLQSLDSPALRAGNWSQLCVTCKVKGPH